MPSSNTNNIRTRTRTTTATMPRDSIRPVYKIEWDWICCVCKFNNSYANHDQCININCQHGRCGSCGKEARRVRVGA
ncbi:hypothetical protein VTI74DRAFT_10062 [Chaetomium olivicolor]